VESKTSHSADVLDGVCVARGYERSKTLQIRLNEDELDQISALARDRALPVSTVARQLLLVSLRPQGDLRSSFDRLERDISALRRQALDD
jgi:hypothetical protein